MGGVLQANESETAEEVQGMLPFDVSETTVAIVLALIVLVIGWYLSKFIVRLAGRTVARRIERPSVTRTILRGVRVSVLVMTGLVALNILGLGGGEILLQVTVISAVIAVVLAPLVGSLINGVFVLADRPYEIGDMIEITDEGHRGFVEDITIRYTKIFTLQNTFIVIPNSAIQERDVVNYSAEDERTRVGVTFGITYTSDLEVARKQAERAARTVDMVISGGPDIRIGSARYAAAPLCTIDEYGDDGIELELRFWIKQPYKQAVAKSAVQSAVRERFAEHGIEFAYPRRHHVFDETSGVARMTLDEPRDRPRDRASVERKAGDGAGPETDAEPGSEADPETDAESGSEADPETESEPDGEAGPDDRRDR